MSMSGRLTGPARAVVAVLVVAIVWLGASVSAAATTPFAPSASTGATGPPTLTADGSSFASLAIQQWVGQVSTLYGIPINWQVTSSVIGLNTFATDQVDFAASDLPYSAGQAEASPTQPYQYLPDVGGGLSFMFNLNGTNGQRITDLNLDAQVIDDIFLGRITRWDDPAIEAINPQLSGLLPATTIIPVYRSDASGENYLLSQYLLNEDQAPFTATQTAFESASPGTPTAVWPTPPQGFDFSTHPGYPAWKNGTPVGQNGSDNAANYVAAPSSVGAITYLEPAYAKEHAFPVASLLNASGADVQPTSLNMATALESATLNADGTQNPSRVFASPEANAYPLSSYSYLVAPCSPSLAVARSEACQGPDATSPFPSAKGAELGKFVHFLACAGQETVASLGYAPLPPNLVQEDFDAIGAMNGGVQPPPPTASNCKNPYIDGQFPLPGAAVSYEEDCTTGFQTGVAAAFVTALKGNTTTTSATPTGQEFGFTGTATTTLNGAFIANIYANGLGSGTSTLQWTETIGSTDGHATGTYKLNTPTISEPDGGGTAPGTVTWTKGSTTLTTTGGGFSGITVGDGVASFAAGIPQSATVRTVAANSDSITISRSTTAAAPASEAASVSWGATTVFSTPVNTGDVFTTNGPSGGTAGIGLVSATQFTAEGLVTFGGATGDGPSNCLLTGWTGSTPPVAGPPQTGGSSPTGDTVPVLPAGSTTPLISASPVEVQPAAYVDLNGAQFSITVNGAATAITNFGSSATLAEVGLPTAATGTITFDTPGDELLCAATLPATSCGTSTTLAAGSYTGISAKYSGGGSYGPSTSTNTVELTVSVLVPTATTASVVPSTTTSGSLVTYSASVASGSVTPTGFVTFSAGSTYLCAAELMAGHGSCLAVGAPPGVDTVTATYVGDATFAGSSGTTTLTVMRKSSSVVCDSLSGTVGSSITFTGCAPSDPARNKTASASASWLSSGGTLTWQPSVKSTAASLTSVSGGQGACPVGSTEDDVTGIVTGGSSLYTHVGDPVQIRACQTKDGGLGLVTGTRARL